MNPSTPHYFLFSQSQGELPGNWSFVLRSANSSDEMEVVDSEPGVQGERLELLCVVRGLEALDQPSKVTVVTPSKYVREGIRYGLSEWRSNGWRWESYGEMVPVKNCDLWQRVDRALRFHQVDDCRRWRLDAAHAAGAPHAAGAAHAAGAPQPVAAPTGGGAAQLDRLPAQRDSDQGWAGRVVRWARRLANRARCRDGTPTRWWVALVPRHRLG